MINRPGLIGCIPSIRQLALRFALFPGRGHSPPGRAPEHTKPTMHEELARRFPDMKPISSPPGLATINGIGTTVVGRRDHDEETGTYVKTLVFCVLFVPIFTLSAYRVADAQRGWYFLGKVPLSRFARVWNLLVALAIAVGAGAIAWTSHTNSPEYRAGRRLAQADELAKSGRQAEAAGAYREVMTGPTAKAGEARQKFVALLDDPSMPADQAAGVYRVARELARQNQPPVPDLFDRGVRLAKQRAGDDPRGALALLETVGPLAPNPADVLAQRRELLEKLVAADPADTESASRLAVVYEATGQREKCEALLAPHEARLGTLDGAAVLGRIHAARGKPDRAAALLGPYVESRLPALRDAETRLRAAADAADQRVLNELRSGHAAGFDYAAFERADKPRQGAMIRDYADAAARNDPALRDARQAVVESAGVVPAALDLGLARLQLAQRATDPAARTRELQAAEQTFLSVRGFAQESDTYRLSLGQVYYWLGKHADGKKQFDELLAARGREFEVLLMVASTLREVGAVTEARALTEEAYQAQTDPRKKHLAAAQRALLFTDLDDDILWLSRSDQDDPAVRASLAYARGNKASREGRTADAVALHREAIDLFGRMTEGAGPLNNAALCHFELHRLTGDAAEFARGLDKLDRAIALKPSDSILLHNAAAVVLDGAIRDTAAGTIDLAVLKRQADWDLLAYLYDGPAGRKAAADRLRAHPGFIKARGYLEKLLLLAPKREDAYAQLARMHAWMRDPAALREIGDRLARVELDLAHQTEEYRDFLAGKSDDKKRAELTQLLTRCRESLAAAGGKKGATYAAAVGDYVRAELAASMIGEPVDADELVTLAERADAATHSDGSATTLRTALAYRAHARLTRSVPDYGAAARATARSLGLNLLDFVLAGGGPLAEKVSADPDVRRRRESLRADVEKWPENFGPNSWAVLAGWDAKAAARIAERSRADETDRLALAVERKIAPYGAATRVQEYLALRMAGKTAETTAVLDDLATQGVKLPRGKSAE